jgi:hypothetical protein
MSEPINARLGGEATWEIVNRFEPLLALGMSKLSVHSSGGAAELGFPISLKH